MFSRISNVKLGKYTASLEDMASEDYNEEDWEALSDVETALDNIGIKLRENANTYRDTETILDEIAEKWDTLDETSQNSVVSALAGTRQREIVLTLFENWDSVENFARISADSYGTAEEKMLAFTDSIEAAQNRVTDAVDQWALWANGAEAMKDFYNILAYVIRNLDTFGITIGLLVGALNAKNIANLIGSGIGGLGSKVIGINNKLSNFASNASLKGVGTSIKDTIFGTMENAYVESVQEKYTAQLIKNTATLQAEDQARAVNLSKTLMEADERDALLYSMASLEDVNIRNAYLSDKYGLAITQANGTVLELLTVQEREKLLKTLMNQVTNDEIKQKLKNIAESKDSQLTEEQLQLITEQLIAARKSQVNQQATAIAGQYRGEMKTSGGAKTAMLTGAATIGTGILTGITGSNIGSVFGEDGQIIGTMLGGTLGEFAAPAMAKALAKGATALASKGIFKGLSTAIGTALGGPIGGLIVSGVLAVVTTLPSIISYWTEKAVEEAANKFQEESDRFSEMTNSLNNVTNFDKYVKGVDSLGRNVSLTEEEYQKWLDASNALAEVFPELTMYTDDQGNKIVGLNGKVTELTDTINKYIDAQQRAADQALLDDTLFEANYKEAKEQYDSAKEQLEIAQETKDLLSETRANYYNQNSLTASYTTDANSKQLQNMVNAINATEIEGVRAWVDPNTSGQFEVQGTVEAINEAFEKAKEALDSNIANFSSDIKEASALMSDEVNAIFREMYYNDEYKNMLEGMSDELKNSIKTLLTGIELDAENEEDFRNQVENLIYDLSSYFQTSGIDISIGVSPDTSMDIDDFRKARQELLNGLIQVFGGSVEELDDTEIAILAKIGFRWDEDTNSFYDAFDSLQQIIDDGLISKVEGGLSALDGTGKYIYTVNELSTAYRILKNSADDATYSQEQLFTQVVRSDYADSSLSELARAYENFVDFSDELTDSEKQRFEIIKNNLDNWSSRLGVVEGDYEAIIEKVKELGDLDYSNMTPDDFMDKFSDYEDLYSYLVNDFEGAWDTDMLSKVYSNEDLIPLIGDPDAMMTRLKGFLDNGEKEYGYVWGNVLAQSEEGTDVLLEQNSDLVKDFAENYNIDLTNFDTLKDAQTTIDAYTTAVIEGNWGDVLNNLAIIYEDDLDNFAGAQQQKIALLGAVLTQMGVVDDVSSGYFKANQDVIARTGELISEGYEDSEYSTAYSEAYQEALKSGKTRDQAKQEAQAVYDKFKNQAIEEISQQYNQEYIQNIVDENLERVQNMMPDFSKITYTPITTTGFSNKATADADSGSSGSGSGDEDIESAKKYLEELQELQNQINKEWEDMVAFANNTDSAYYGKMRLNLTAQLEEVNRLLANFDEYLAAGSLEESDYNDLLKQQIELQVEINNLDDEQVQEAIDLLETQDASIVSLIEAQKQLIATSDTYEELVERQQELNDLLEQQRELQRDVYEFERDMAEMATEYVSGTAYSNSRIYEAMMSLQKQSVEQQMESLLDSYNTVIAQKIQQYSSEGLSAGEAYNMAYDSEEARDLIQQYWELFQEYGDLVYQEFEDKVNELDQMIEDVESTKPQEWGNMSDIAPYYETLIGYIEKKVEQIEKALQNVDGLTDEQIQDLVDSYNDAVDALQEAAQSQLEDTISYQESEFDALIDWLEEYKQSIEDIDLDEIYDPLIDDAEDAIDDGNDILDILEQIKNLDKEKTRVYREGEALPSIKVR